MKKTKLTLAAWGALAGFNACAQTTGVTLYGVVDVPVEYVNRVATAQPTVVNGQLVFANTGGSRVSMLPLGGRAPSRWGLRGVEDLGGGNSAVFVLENGFTPDTGALATANRIFSRQAYVGLQSNTYGKLMFGRQYTSLFEGMSNFTPTRYASTYDPVAWQLGINYREDNTVKYLGVFGPVTVAAHYSFGVGVPLIGVTPLAGGGAGETPGAPRDNNGYGAAVTYLNGTFGAALAYDEWHPAVTSGQQGVARKLGTAVSYASGPFKAMAGYRWARTGFANGNTLARDDYYWAGVNYDITQALELTVAYYYADFKSLRLAPTAASSNPANPWQTTAILDYRFSKRTDVYLSTAYARNAGLNFDSTQTAFLFNYPPMAGQKGMFGVSAGIRHVF